MKPLANVLLVEDDALVMEVLTMTLEQVADRVVPASSGTEGLEALERQAFSAIVTDLRLPGASGLSVLDRARALQPEARLVLISGYADDEAADHLRRLGGRLLHKPFGVSELLVALGCAAGS